MLRSSGRRCRRTYENPTWTILPIRAPHTSAQTLLVAIRSAIPTTASAAKKLISYANLFWNSRSFSKYTIPMLLSDRTRTVSNMTRISNTDSGAFSIPAIAGDAANNTDTTTPGPGNQYSAYPGTAGGGSQFGVAFDDTASITLTSPVEIGGGYFTNTTYTALSMLNGDAFAKMFGGPSGDDPDWFNVTIEGWLSGVSTGTEVLYLADYRFEDNASDYVVDTWTWVELSGLGTVDQLTFTFDSSDVDPQFGVNTPRYVALDDLLLIPEPSTALLLGLGLIGMTAARQRS